jgi:hypothetical protein
MIKDVKIQYSDEHAIIVQHTDVVLEYLSGFNCLQKVNVSELNEFRLFSRCLSLLEQSPHLEIFKCFFFDEDDDKENDEDVVHRYLQTHDKEALVKKFSKIKILRLEAIKTPLSSRVVQFLTECLVDLLEIEFGTDFSDWTDDKIPTLDLLNFTTGFPIFLIQVSRTVETLGDCLSPIINRAFNHPPPNTVILNKTLTLKMTPTFDEN